MNLVTEVRETADAHPDRTAVAVRGTELTYESFWERTGRFAAALADRNVGPGDRVAIYLPNLPQFVTAFHGTLRAGGVVVPMNPAYRAREIEHLLADSEASVVVTLGENLGELATVAPETDVEHVVTVDGQSGGAGDASGSATADADSLEVPTVDFDAFLADETFPVVDRGDDDVAVQPYTSGTTGTPKGVLLTHRNLAWTARANADLIGGIEPDDDLIGTLPLFHIYGMSVVMNGALFDGATYHPVAAWDVETVLALIERERITVMFGVPAMFNDVISHPDADSFDVSSLRFVNSGGSSLPMEVLERFEELFDVTLYEGYGLTETSPTTHANGPDARRKGSIGRPFDGLESMVVDDEFEPVPRVEEGPVEERDVALDEITGEIVVSGPNVMMGYAGLPEATEEVFTESEGRRWFHTGDVGYWDEDDFFYLVDRETHVIVTGGYNVYPREVEELLYEHPAVADAAVVGVPDDRRGETVAAFVVPASEGGGQRSADPAAADGITSDAIREYCLEHLAPYKHPREVELVDELPRTATGKVQKFALQGEE